MKPKAIIEMDLIQELVDSLEKQDGGLYERSEIINWLLRQGKIIQDDFINNS